MAIPIILTAFAIAASAFGCAEISRTSDERSDAADSREPDLPNSDIIDMDSSGESDIFELDVFSDEISSHDISTHDIHLSDLPLQDNFDAADTHGYTISECTDEDLDAYAGPAKQTPSGCVPFERKLFPKTDEACSVISFSIENFPSKAMIYYPSWFTEKDKDTLFSSINAPAEFVARKMREMYDLDNPYKTLEIFVRPSCEDFSDNPEKTPPAGSEWGNQIRLVPNIGEECDFDANMHYGYKPNLKKFISTFAHELSHAFTFGGLYDPFSVINEGVAVSMEVMFNSEMSDGLGIYYMYSQPFPDQPATPVVDKIIKVGDSVEIDMDGERAQLSLVEHFTDSYCRFDVDGEFYFGAIADGPCGVSLDNKYYGCVLADPLDGSSFQFKLFSADDGFIRMLFDRENISVDEMSAYTRLFIWSGDHVFTSETDYTYHVPIMYDFSGLEENGKLTEPGQYLAAFGLVNIMEQMAYDADPVNPLNVYKKLGGRIRSCREEGNSCQPFYSALPEIAGASQESIDDLLISMGLDPTAENPHNRVCYPFGI